MSSPVVELPCAPLVRFWMDRGLIDPTPPTQDLGARLGAWVDVRQAIQLHQLLGKPSNAPSRSQAQASDWIRQVEDALDRLREAISTDRTAPGLWRNPMPVEVNWQPLVWAEFWEPYRRYMVDHQKQMGLVLGRLRRQARAALCDAGGPCHALAQLDAVYDQTLTPRETRCLASLPYKFESRLSALVKSLGLTTGSPPLVPASSRAQTKPDWLLSFERDIRESLLAELQLRAQPVLGLIDAYQTHCP